MAPRRLHKLPVLLFINSFSSFSTSFIIPITLLHSKWFISNPSNSHLIPLKSFLNTLTNYHSDPQKLIIQLQIDTIQTYNNQLIHKLCNIINQSDIFISKTIIISQQIPVQIIQTITNQNLSIIINIKQTYINPSRKLLSNHTISNTKYETIEMETWLCKPWPIYIGFFAGILVTLIITWLINLTTGEKDNELENALEKVITAGIETSMKRKRDGPVEIDVGAPNRHKKYRTNSAILVYNTNQIGLGSPRAESMNSRSYVVSRSRVRKGSITHNRRISHNNEPSWATDLVVPTLKDRNVSVTTKLTSAEIKHQNLINKTFSIDEEVDTDHEVQYDRLKADRNSYTLKIHTGPETKNFLMPHQYDITPKSDDVYLSSDSTTNDIPRNSDEMSLSELITGSGITRKSGDSESDTNDPPIMIITHQQVEHVPQEKDEKKSINNNNLNNNNKMAQKIDLSPIVESVVDFDQFRMRQQRYRINRNNNNNTHDNGQYVKRLSGKTIRIGFNLNDDNNDYIDVDPYDCLGTSSDNSIEDDNVDETLVDDNYSNETVVDDDGMDGDDESGRYSNNDNEFGDEEEVP